MNLVTVQMAHDQCQIFALAWVKKFTAPKPSLMSGSNWHSRRKRRRGSTAPQSPAARWMRCCRPAAKPTSNVASSSHSPQLGLAEKAGYARSFSTASKRRPCFGGDARKKCRAVHKFSAPAHHDRHAVHHPHNRPAGSPCRSAPAFLELIIEFVERLADVSAVVSEGGFEIGLLDQRTAPRRMAGKAADDGREQRGSGVARDEQR